jgi:asparagine synthase (glutamine-hydrolysing)
MCGLAGVWAQDRPVDDACEIAGRMAARIVHRGPDDSGIWVEREAGLVLAHRRLAIVDLSAAGHQPMLSHSGRMVIAYNGELYNSADLRRELEGAGAARDWRGHSDTETLIEAIEHWGVVGALERSNGMFAFASWDRQERTLTLARDRLGEKPLYYGRAGRDFVFGSELKALVAHPDFVGTIDDAALSQFLRHSFVPAPLSIWRGISKLPPAHYLEVRAGGTEVGEPIPYWDLRNVAERGAAAPLADTPELTDRLEVLLKDAVLRRMVADVPLGAFLSGGIDSSAIVALMQAQSPRPVRTFTIGFGEKEHDEAEHAAAIARHLGTDHTELYVRAGEALDLVPSLPEIWDEPFADASQIPTYIVSKLAREHVTVSLSGDAGDELFAGYKRYFIGQRMNEWAKRAPGPVRRLAAGALAAPKSARMVAAMEKFGAAGRGLNLADRLSKVALLLREETPAGIHSRLLSNPVAPEQLLAAGRGADFAARTVPDFADFREWMMCADTLGYLPDDILVKLDRASMAVSLESRVPLLDHRLVELAWRIPMSAKMKGGVGKRILRDVLYRHVPQALVDRPKKGFSAPIETWLRGPLRDWAEALLDPTLLRDEGYFEIATVRRIWDEHVRGARRWHNTLWPVLMFQAWQQEQRIAALSPRGATAAPAIPASAA